MKKRILSMLLCIVLVLGLLPTAASAADLSFTARYSETDSSEIEITKISGSVPTYLVKCKEGTTNIQLHHTLDDNFAILFDYSGMQYSIDPNDLQETSGTADRTRFYNADCYADGWWTLDLENHLGTVTSNTVAGTLDGVNVYLFDVPSQCTPIQLKQPSGSLIYAYSSDDEASLIYNKEIARENEYFTSATAYFTAKKSQITGVTYADGKDYLLARVAELDIGTFTTKTTAYVLIAWEKASTPDVPKLSDEEKKPLSDLLATVEDDQTLYYTEGDRYNGVEADTVTEKDGSLWKNFTAAKGPRETARKLLDTANTTDAILAGKDALQAEIDKLIPTSRINATELYETIDKYEHTYYERDEDRPLNKNNQKTGYLLSSYTEVSANAYREALAAAKAYLGTLFADGKPTDENVAENKHKAEERVTALTGAAKDLARTWDPYSTRALAIDAIPELCRRADAAVENISYTVASREALKTARDKAKALYDEQTASKENLTASEYNDLIAEYQKLFDAYYMGLQNEASSVHVRVRLADTTSLKPSQYSKFNGDWDAVSWTGEITLTDDQTLGGLEKALGSKLYYGGRNDGLGASSYLFLINGIYPNSLRGSQTYFSDYADNTYYSDRYTLHDGDTVELFFVPTPTIASYTGYNSLYNTDAMRFIQRARFEKDGEELTTLTVTEGDTLTLHTTRAYAALPTYTGEYTAFSGAKLFVSPEGSGADLTSDTYGNAAAPTVDTGLVTDENGDVTVTLTTPGWVHLYAVDTSADKGSWGNTDVSNVKNIEALPCMTAGASVWVEVKAMDGDDLKAALDGLIAQLDESYENLERIRLTAAELETVDADYAAKREAIANAESYSEGNKLLQAFQANLKKLLDAHPASTQGLAEALSYLPDSVEEFTQGFRERFANIKAIADSLTTYQYQQLNAAQKAKYEKLLAAYGEDGSGLPETKNPTVKVSIKEGAQWQEDFHVGNDRSYTKYVSADYANGDARVNVPRATNDYNRVRAALGEFDAADYHVQEGSNYQLTIARVLEEGKTECTYNGTVKRIEVLDADTGLPLDAKIDIYNYTSSFFDSKCSKFLVYPDLYVESAKDYGYEGVRDMISAQVTISCVLPRNIQINVYLEAADTPDPIIAIRDAAKQALENELKKYTHTDYTDENWALIIGSYNKGLAAIDRAETEEAVNAARESAIEAMRAVEKRAAGALGRVHVIVENTLFTEDKWPEGTTYWAGTLVDEWVDLTADDTMMSCVVRALENNKCRQEGAESNYIGSITDSQGHTLSQMDGGGTSGWMGTLNDWFTYRGFGEFTVENGWLSDGDEIHIMYTMDGLGEDLGSISSKRPNGQNTTLASLTAEGGEIQEAFQSGAVGSTNNYTLKINGATAQIKLTPTAVNKNYLTRIFLNEKHTADFDFSEAPANFYKSTWSIPVKVGDKIYVGCGEKGWPTMNANSSVGENQTANGTWYVLTVTGDVTDDGSAAVIALIDKNCYTPTQYGYKAQMEKVKAAREAYEALSLEARENVTNYQKLVAAENAIKSFQKTDALKERIAALPSVRRVTLDDEQEVLAVKEIFDSLNEEESARMSVYEANRIQELLDKLQELHNALDQEAADKVIKLISDIGEVSKDSGDKIKAARNAYTELTEAQQKLVSNYNDLLAAEKRYKELTEPDEPVDPDKPTKPSKPSSKPESPNKPKDETTLDATKFDDVSKNSWYKDAVQYVYENGLMTGTSSYLFSPNADTTRGMIVTILARLEGENTNGNPWYAAGRKWAMANDISDGTNMEGKITREQLAAMLYRYAKMKGYNFSASADISGYADASSVSGWALDAMQWAVGAGLINGRTATTLAPQGNATRAEVAAILMRFAQNIAKK